MVLALSILIFSIAMGADSSFYVKSIASYAPTIFEIITSVLARVIDNHILLHFCHLLFRLQLVWISLLKSIWLNSV